MGTSRAVLRWRRGDTRGSFEIAKWSMGINRRWLLSENRIVKKKIGYLVSFRHISLTIKWKRFRVVSVINLYDKS